MRVGSFALALSAVALALAAPAAAQEVKLTGPLDGCIARSDRYTVPATVEWSYWVTGGVSVHPDERGVVRPYPVAGVGAELTTGVLQYAGFPAPSLSHRQRARRDPPWHGGAFAELRVGPWAEVQTRSPGGLVEAGLTAHLGTVNDEVNTLVFHAPFGMFDLRLGAGYGAFPGGRSPHVAISVGWGYRVVFDRGTWGLPCDPPPPPPRVASASVARLVITLRRATELPAWEAVLAVELSPTWLVDLRNAVQNRLRKR